jgi:hypothetical protein
MDRDQGICYVNEEGCKTEGRLTESPRDWYTHKKNSAGPNDRQAVGKRLFKVIEGGGRWHLHGLELLNAAEDQGGLWEDGWYRLQGYQGGNVSTGCIEVAYIRVNVYS